MASTHAARASLGSAWFLTTCAVLLASIGLVLRGRDMEPMQPVETVVASVWPSSQGASPGPSLRQEAPTVTGTESDPEAILAAFWGADWPHVRAELEASGLLPDELPEIQPWDEVESDHAWSLNPISNVKGDLYYRTLMGWPGREFDDHADLVSAAYAEATPENLAKYLRLPELSSLDESQLFTLEERLAETNAELDGLIRSFMAGIGEAVSFEFRTGLVERVPLAFPEPESYDTDPGFYGHTAQAGGWASRVQLTEVEYPDLAVMRRQIMDMRGRRTSEVRRVVQELLQPDQG